MAKITDENLQIIIEGLEDYKDDGIIDPWVLDNGEIIEPLDVLLELKELRDKQGISFSHQLLEPPTHTQVTFMGETGHWYCAKRLRDQICCSCVPHEGCEKDNRA